MKTTLSERDGNTAKLAVEVSTEEVQEAFNTHLKKLSREVRMPGFRPGKAPLTMVRQRLGDEAILIEAVEESMGAWFAEATMELGLDPVDRPEIELGQRAARDGQAPGFHGHRDRHARDSAGRVQGVEGAQGICGGSGRGSRCADGSSAAMSSRNLRPVTGRAVQKGDFVTADLASLPGREAVGGSRSQRLRVRGGRGARVRSRSRSRLSA